MSTSITTCLYVIFIIFQITSYISTDKISPVNSTELATKYGHPPIQYNVVTEDGYILSVYRLPGQSKIPVLLTHGLLDCSDTWLARGNTSLAIALANKGQDVWLANIRGNRYSRRHKYLNPDKDPAFWRFSFHEIGYYDLPAIIDMILKKTGAKKINAIGHSQGNTIYYVLGSQRQDYNSKVNVMIALAPVAFLHHTVPPVSTVMQSYPFIRRMVKTLGIHELVGDTTTLGQLIHIFCSQPNIIYSVCINGLVFPVMGYDKDEFEPEFARAVAMSFPAGTSAQSVLHFLQVGYTKAFAQYDYGKKINRRLYKSTKPPRYELEKVTMPIALLAGKNDRLSELGDVAILRQRLPNVIYYNENPRSVINHLDYLLGRNMPDYIFPYVFRVLVESNNLDD